MNRPILCCMLLLTVACGTTSFAAEPATQPAANGPRIRLEKLFKLDKPVYALHDHAGRVFFIEQPGRVLLYENGAIAKTPYLDITKETFLDYECGLLSIAFHPKFAENGYFYADYTRKEKEQIRTYIVEFHVDPKAKQVDASTERVLLTIDQPYVNHKGGQLQFGADGMLYIGMGDGGSMQDPHNNAQNPNVLLGKLLRIDVSVRDGYAIPKDNPFVGKEGYRPEIWTLGMRNPWRFSFDRATGLLYEGDVGQDDFEEVNLIEKGGNYGWRIRDGTKELHPVPNPPTMIDPVYEYSHNKGAASITGGYVYHGKRIPALQGWYIFGDYVHGWIDAIKVTHGKTVGSVRLIDPQDPDRTGGQRPTQPSSFGEDADGELFMLDVNGPVYRILPP